MGVNKVVFGAVAIMDISDSTVTPDKLAKGVTAYDKSGEKITGTMEAATDPKLQEKTVTPATSAQSVTPDSGYDGLSKVIVNAMPTATQATPSISVSSSGLITASATQTAGYVAAGTKSATKQLTTQAAKTITPSTSSQTAVAAGRYTTGAVTVAAIPSTYVKPTTKKAATTYTPSTSNQTIAAGTYCSGAQTIKGDANLVAGNIKSGVSIFGVAGSYEGSGGGGGASLETCTVTIINEADQGWQGNDRLMIIATVLNADGSMSPFHTELELGSVSIQNVVCHVTLSIESMNGNAGTLTNTNPNSVVQIFYNYDGMGYPAWLVQLSGDDTITLSI